MPWSLFIHRKRLQRLVLARPLLNALILAVGWLLIRDAPTGGSQRVLQLAVGATALIWMVSLARLLWRDLRLNWYAGMSWWEFWDVELRRSPAGLATRAAFLVVPFGAWGLADLFLSLALPVSMSFLSHDWSEISAVGALPSLAVVILLMLLGAVFLATVVLGGFAVTVLRGVGALPVAVWARVRAASRPLGAAPLPTEWGPAITGVAAGSPPGSGVTRLEPDLTNWTPASTSKTSIGVALMMGGFAALIASGLGRSATEDARDRAGLLGRLWRFICWMIGGGDPHGWLWTGRTAVIAMIVGLVVTLMSVPRDERDVRLPAFPTGDPVRDRKAKQCWRDAAQYVTAATPWADESRGGPAPVFSDGLLAWLSRTDRIRVDYSFEGTGVASIMFRETRKVVLFERLADGWIRVSEMAESGDYSWQGTFADQELAERCVAFALGKEIRRLSGLHAAIQTHDSPGHELAAGASRHRVTVDMFGDGRPPWILDELVIHGRSVGRFPLTPRWTTIEALSFVLDKPLSVIVDSFLDSRGAPLFVRDA